MLSRCHPALRPWPLAGQPIPAGLARTASPRSFGPRCKVALLGTVSRETCPWLIAQSRDLSLSLNPQRRRFEIHGHRSAQRTPHPRTHTVPPSLLPAPLLPCRLIPLSVNVSSSFILQRCRFNAPRASQPQGNAPAQQMQIIAQPSEGAFLAIQIATNSPSAAGQLTPAGSINQ